MIREIYAYKCRKCGHLHYPYRMVCKNCGENEHNEFDPVPLPRTGKVVTFTQVHTLPPDFMVAKLGLAIVELENGLKILGQLESADPRIGMAVKGEVEVVRRDAYDQFYGMVFREA